MKKIQVFDGLKIAGFIITAVGGIMSAIATDRINKAAILAKTEEIIKKQK